jgi:colanic acid biosynthesis glycosyl transferase WcaI
MTLLILNRVYPPAEGATGHLIRELATALCREGWHVTVVTGPAPGSPGSEMMDGVRVERAGAFAFSEGNHWRRLGCYLALYPALLWRALRLPAADVVITMTDPPLLLLLGPLLKRLKGARLLHWSQDIYPEIAEELGVIAKDKLLARLCRTASTRALLSHDRIVAIGRCMKKRLLQRGVPGDRLEVIPNWAPPFHPIDHADNPFRSRHHLAGRFVVMYSGHFGLAHSFSAMIDAAELLQISHPRILFLFIGTGPRLAEIKDHPTTRRLANVRFLPAQTPETLAESLGAADLHLASLQPSLCGLAVPSKIYGILAVGRPCLFLGSREREGARLIEDYHCGSVIDPPSGAALAATVLEWATDSARRAEAGRAARVAAQDFSLTQAVSTFGVVLRELANEDRPAQILPSAGAEPFSQHIASKAKT